MKKLLIVAILMLALVVTIAACTQEETPVDTNAVTTAGENATVAGPADETTAAPADETTEAPADETTAAPADETNAPADETAAPETTEEETTVDPADPVLLLDAEAIHGLASAGTPNVNQLGNSEVITEGAYTFARWTAAGGDPYVAFIPLNSSYTLPQYLAIAYRTNSAVEGQIFMGSGAGWTGAGDVFGVTWNEGDWNYVVIDLTAQGLTSVTDGLLTYARFDFFAGDSAEGDYFDIEYIGFFNSAEYAEAYAFAKHPPYVEVEDAAAGKVGHSFDTFYVNGQMYFPEDGGAGDKLTAINNTISFAYDDTRESISLRGWIGFGQTIESFGYFIDNYTMVWGDFKQATEAGVLAAGGENASRFMITIPVDGLEGGVHFVGFVVKLADGTVVRLRENIKIVVVPYTEDEMIMLADRGPGVTPSCSPSDKKLGQRFTVSEGFLKSISVTHMATYADDNENTWTFKVWQWNGDYATTVAGTPLFSASGENHQDNSSFVMNIPVELMISGDIYYEAEYLTGKGGFTGWNAEGVVAEGVESYVAGNKVAAAFASSIIVAVPSDATPEEIPEHQLQNPPVYIIKAKDMLMSNANQLTYEKMDGYVHFVPMGGDPNFMLFQGQTGSRYVSIKYRTEYTANIQIFLGSTGAGPTDDTVMMEMALIPDGEWHLAIFDTQVLVDRGVYDGSTAAYLRLDVMESGYECDANGDPIRDPDGTWHKLPLPEGATIDIAYVAFFETEEKANGYEYAPETPDEGGDEPEAPAVENLVIPQDQWVISGHKTAITTPDDATHGGMIAAGGVESAALLHQGSIALGEIDLSKYSKVVIYWGSDNSQVTIDAYNANANNRFALVNADKTMVMSPDEATIIAAATYELHGWAVAPFEIDLTDIDYNGPVFLTHDSLPGGFALVYSIEFVA